MTVQSVNKSAANFYIVVSQDVVTVAQLFYLKCMHVLVETSIYMFLAIPTEASGSMYVLTLMFHLYHERNSDAQEILLALLLKILVMSPKSNY